MRNRWRWLLFGAGALCAGASYAGAYEHPLPAVLSGTAHQALFAISMQHNQGLAVGAAGELQVTRDAGKHWQAVTPAPTDLALLGVDIAAGNALAVGQMGLILRRTDQGAWTKVESGTTERLMTVQMNDAGVAVAVGAFGTVLMSGDAGQNWHSIAPTSWAEYGVEMGIEPHLYDTVLDAKGVITIAGEFGLIMRSSDAGASWQQLYLGKASIFGLQLRDDGIGYAVGQKGLVLRSADHGATWTKLDAGTQALLLGVYATANSKVLITGMHTMLLSRDGGDSWGEVVAPDVQEGWYADMAQGKRGAPVLAVGYTGRVVPLRP